MAIASRIAPADQFVFVDEVYYDLSYYLKLKQPPVVVSDWG